MSLNNDELIIPSRIELINSKNALSGIRGTIKFKGNVNKTEGAWLGIEWDDIQRGKHDGVKDNIRYFKPKKPNSATFIRPSNKLYKGQSFLQCLRYRYNLNSDNDIDNDLIPNYDKLKSKFSKLSELKVVGVDKLGCNCKVSNEQFEISRDCQNVKHLSIAHSLVSNLKDVDNLLACLPSIQSLDLSSNRFEVGDGNYNSLNKLKTLLMNNTLMDWCDLSQLTNTLTQLEELEIANNEIKLLSNGINTFQNLQILNLSQNHLSDWANIENELINIPTLSTLILDNNLINSIPYPTTRASTWGNLKSLIISNNYISDWASIDALALRVPLLESLSLTDCPIMNKEKSKQLIVGRFEKLKILNMSILSNDEIRESQLIYISKPPTDEDPKKARYQILSDTIEKPKGYNERKLTNLQLKLIVVEIQLLNNNDKHFNLRTINSMPIRNLKILIKNKLKVNKESNISLTASIKSNQNCLIDEENENENFTERMIVDLNDDFKDLSWFKVDNNDKIFIEIS